MKSAQVRFVTFLFLLFIMSLTHLSTMVRLPHEAFGQHFDANDFLEFWQDPASYSFSKHHERDPVLHECKEYDEETGKTTTETWEEIPLVQDRLGWEFLFGDDLLTMYGELDAYCKERGFSTVQYYQFVDYVHSVSH